MLRKFFQSIYAPEIVALEQRIIDIETAKAEETRFWRLRYQAERKDHLATMQREEQILERLLVANGINPTSSIREIEVERLPHTKMHSADNIELSDEEYQILWSRAEEAAQIDAGEGNPITSTQIQATFDLMVRDKETYLTN